MFVLRRRNATDEEVVVDESRRMQLAGERDGDPDEEKDEDWVPRNEEDNEPLEYDSGADENEDENEGGSDVDMADVEELEREAAEQEVLKRSWIEVLTSPKTNYYNTGGHVAEGLPAWFKEPLVVERIEIEDSMHPIFVSDGGDHGDDANESPVLCEDSSHQRMRDRHSGEELGYYSKHSGAMEHIAGPGCINSGGYSGHNISAEEMRGCQVAQCLMRKPRGWKFVPAEDDEDFEKEGDFFLSGLIDHMPSRDIDWPRALPPRHGCDKPHGENIIWEENDIEEYGMPFHPWCFEVFKRASLLKRGYIDVPGLVKWWTDDAVNHRFDERSHGKDVAKCKDQEWLHVNRTEYLVANPLYVPKLQDILQEVTNTAPDFTPRNSAFHIPQHMHASSSSDLFESLPAELRFKILDHLHSKNIAALRLASRAFRQIPIAYFQKLLNRQMPWLWEAWPTLLKPDHPAYSFWATVTASEAVRKLQHPQKEISYLNDYVEIVGREMPELKPVLEEALPEAIQRVLDEHQLEVELDKDRKPFFLPPGRTDYHLLYVLIKRHWKQMRGLRNRLRIWNRCKDIIKQIEKLEATSGDM